MANLRCRKGMDVVSQIRHSGLAHLLLMGDGNNRKLASLLLDQRERRRLGFLSVRFSINTVSVETMSISCHISYGLKTSTQWSMGGYPPTGIAKPRLHRNVLVDQMEQSQQSLQRQPKWIDKEDPEQFGHIEKRPGWNQ